MPPVEPPAVAEAVMGKRGSETRRKVQSVLVRLDDSEHVNLSAAARLAGVTRAAYLRRLLQENTGVRSDETGNGGLLDADRMQLSALTRSMGHLAGLMKLAVMKTPAIGAELTIRTFLDQYRKELQELQGQIRGLLGRIR